MPMPSSTTATPHIPRHDEYYIHGGDVVFCVRMSIIWHHLRYSKKGINRWIALYLESTGSSSSGIRRGSEINFLTRCLLVRQ